MSRDRESIQGRLAASLTPYSRNTITRGHNYKLYAPAISSDTRKYFFSNRIVQIWNELPVQTDFSTLKRFKNSISKVDLTKYCADLQ